MFDAYVCEHVYLITRRLKLIEQFTPAHRVNLLDFDKKTSMNVLFSKLS